MKLSAPKVALVFGIIGGGWHLLWSILVITGVGQALLDFIFWAHMIANPYRVTGFVLERSLVLIVVTFVLGYVFGWVFGWLWNYLHKR